MIEISVKNNRIIGEGAEIGASGSHGAESFRIRFPASWDSLDKKAYFADAYNEAVEIPSVLTLVTGETDVYDLPVPKQALRYPGDLKLTLKGYTEAGGEETSAVLTAFGTFRILDSGVDPDADSYENELLNGEY